MASRLPTVDRRNPSSAAGQQEDLLTRLAQWILMAAIVLTVWSIGGYYPLGRFISLALLGCALIAYCLSPGGLSPRRLAEAMSPARRLLAVLICLMLIGLVQAFGTPDWMPMEWTGVQQIRSDLAFMDGSASPDSVMVETPVGKFAATLTLDPWATKTWLAMACIGVVGFLLGAVLIRTSRSRLLLLFTLVATGVSQVIWGIAQITRRPGEILYGIELEGASELFGSFVNRNHAADFLGMSLAAALGIAWWCYRRDTSRQRSAYDARGPVQLAISNPISFGTWLCIVFLGIGVVSTLSRGGWISIAAGLLLVPLCWQPGQQPRRARWIAVVGSLGLVVFLAMQFFGLRDRVNKRMDDLEVENLLADSRLTHWAESFPAVEHFFPLGSGLGTYGYAYIPFNPQPDNVWFTHAHNQYLETAMELGLPGLLLLFAGLFFSATYCLNLSRRRRDYTKEALGVATLGSLAIQALHAVTDFGIMMPANLLTFSVLMGAAAAAAPRAGIQTIAKSDASRVRRAPSAGSATTAVANGGWFGPACAMLSLLLCGSMVAAAIWHQQRCVRSANLLAATEYSPQTPSPTTDTALQWIQDIESEMEKSPDNTQLLGRLIQLRFHRAHRATYDQLVQPQRAQQRGLNPIVNWNATALESVIWNLYADSQESDSQEFGRTEQQKSSLRQSVQAEPDLKQAWSDLLRSLQINPVQPRVHYRLALLGAASGKNWQPYFDNSVKLSVVDPDLSLGNGLLAWVAGQRDTMINQFRQTLATDSTQVSLIFNILRLQLTDQEIIERLTPTRWVVSYRMARMIEDQPEYAELYDKLMQRADSLAEATVPDGPARYRARGIIAAARGDHEVAVEHYRRAAETDPKNPELRYRLALSLIRAGRPQEAVSAARIAHHLSPKERKYRDLFNQAQRLHRRDFESQMTHAKASDAK